MIDGTYELTTLKTEMPRFIPKFFLSDNFNESLKDRLDPYDGLTYDQLTRDYRKVVKLAPLAVGSRLVDTYLFRYNRARQFYESTKELTRLMDWFGWNSPSIAMGYLHNPVIYRPAWKF
jgi:hypothetical protein